MSKKWMKKHPNWVKHKGDRKSENYKLRKFTRENPLKKTSKFDGKKKQEEEERLRRQKEIEEKEREEEEEEVETKSVFSDDDDEEEEEEEEVEMEGNEDEEGAENSDDEEEEEEEENEQKIDIKSLPKRIQQKIRYQERKNKRLAEKKKPKKGKVFMDVI